MRERVAKLRRESVDAVPSLSIERALLITETHRQYEGKVSAPVLRALAFKHLLENKAVFIGDGELIVGERGERPKATPTYPELCCHTLEDFDVVDSREKTFFRVGQEARAAQADEIIPFWQDRAIRKRLLDQMTPEWKDCYEAGMFTEFMEQRAPGHTVADGKIYQKGFLDFKEDIGRALSALDFLGDPEAYAKQEELRAMDIACDAIIHFGQRHARKAREMAAGARDRGDMDRAAELDQVAEVCSWVPAHAPRTFREALQMYWFVHLGVISELNTWDAFNPGRLDQHLYPFYKREIEAGTLTREDAKELLQCFWVKFNNQPAPPKVGITLAESGTYTDFANINSGGLRADGSDGVNDVTYLVLEVIDEMRLLQPSSNIQLSAKNPDKFLKAACQIIRKGWGQPSVFNADAVVQELLLQGKSVEDARCGGTSGCVETGAFGKESYILTGYFNIPKVLEITLHNGVDPRTGKRIGPKTGDPSTFQTHDDLFAAFVKQMGYFLDIKVRGNNVIEKLYAEHMPCPFLSVTVSDCIRNGRDYNAGGARYHSRYVQGVGIGSIADSLAAVKKFVYDGGADGGDGAARSTAWGRLLSAIDSNFECDEALRQILINRAPKYGNDDDYVDSIMRDVFNAFHDAVDGRKSPTGGTYRIDMLPTTCHVYFGLVMGASPDGRLAGMPLSEGISPVQGRDRLGPTAVLLSAAKMDHTKTGGTLLNQKFTPKVLEGDEGLSALMNLIRAYFKLGGHHIQFNVVSASTLRKAQEHPEDYRDLIVRVAGYSDYFCDLSKALQDEIIARTEHSRM